jgi:glycosyltransferase involved in cell wall biosynthesis
MKILHVIGSMDPASGGPCQGIRNLNPISILQNVHREVVSLDDPNSIFIGSDLFAVHALGPGRGPWQYSSKLIPWLLKNLTRFDVVIVNGIWLYHEYAVIRTIKILRDRKINFKNDSKKLPKVFLMPHGMLDPYFQKTSSRRLKAIRNLVYWNLIEKNNIREVNGLLFTCEEELRLARKSFKFYNPRKELNIGYGVEEPPGLNKIKASAFSERCPALNGYPYILYLGRIHPKKGVDLLVTGYLQLLMTNTLQKKDKIPRLVIAGPGLDTSFGKKLLRLVSVSSEFKSYVLFPGMVTGEVKWSALHGCEAFILPSHQENFGISVVEALACKKPVLISDKINIWKEIVNKKGGMVNTDSLSGTKELLYNWLSLSTEEKSKMSDRARMVFDEHFAFYPAGMKFLEAIQEN